LGLCISRGRHAASLLSAASGIGISAPQKPKLFATFIKKDGKITVIPSWGLKRPGLFYRLGIILGYEWDSVN